MKTYLFGLLLPLLPLLPPLPLLFSLLQTWSPRKMRPNEILVCLPSIYNLIILLIASRSSISQKLHFNFCYSYFGILSSLIMTFMSHLINYTFTLILLQQFRVHKFMISQFHLKNTTMALGAHMRPLKLHVLYTFSGRGVTNPPSLEHLVLEMKILNSKEKKVPHSENN